MKYDLDICMYAFLLINHCWPVGGHVRKWTHGIVTGLRPVGLYTGALPIGRSYVRVVVETRV